MSDDPIIAALARLEAGQTALRDDLAAMRDDLFAMRGNQASMRDDLIAVRTALMDRIDRVQHAVDLLRDDIVVNYGAASRTERIAKGASDETRALADEVHAMQRQIARLRTDIDELRGEA
jgi:hypothetical protein